MRTGLTSRPSSGPTHPPNLPPRMHPAASPWAPLNTPRTPLLEPSLHHNLSLRSPSTVSSTRRYT
ncbi:hypothetical protein BDD12DRAFT_849606 [Trichophaea hybrida]|nr:hypothetical protein BDD12DRAFT_849606 [Trichophaea hybrida]